MKKYSYLPGFALILAAVFRASWNVAWDATDAWLLGGGVAVVAASVALNWPAVAEWFRDPRGIFALNTGIALVLYVGILVLINILTWYRPLQVDLTASGRNTLRPETLKLLADLDTDIRLRQFGRVQDPRRDQLLEAFVGGSRRVSVEFVDAERHPQEARDFQIYKPGTIVVTAGSKYRKVEEPSEPALATAILQVTDESMPVVCFVGGHGERGLSDTGGSGLAKLRDLLTASNFEVRSLSLLAGDVPAACSAVLVVGPQRDLDGVETDRLSRYVGNGGRVGVFVDPAPGASMADWLGHYGIHPRDALIVDENANARAVGVGPETPLAWSYGDHAITRGFGIATMYDGARPLETEKFGDYGGKPVILAQTSEQATAREGTKANGAGHASGGAGGSSSPGPAGTTATTPASGTRLTLAVATSINTRDRRGREAPPLNDEARIAAFGDSDFVSNAFLGRQGNRDFFVRTVSWLVGEAERHVVDVSERENRRVDLSERAKFWMYVVNLGLIPLVPLVGGIVALIRSKR